MLVQQNTDHGFDSLNHTPDPAPFQAKVKRRRKPMTREVLKARGAKIAAAKLAKRATLQCETCSNPFPVARHDLWRKRCPVCVRLGKRISKKKIHAKTCPVCKTPFTTARAEAICCSVKCARVGTGPAPQGQRSPATKLREPGGVAESRQIQRARGEDLQGKHRQDTNRPQKPAFQPTPRPGR